MKKFHEELKAHGLDDDAPFFPPEVLAEATALPLNTVRMWSKRIGSEDPHFVAASRRGSPSTTSFRSVATYVAAAPLVKTGVDVATAYRAAKEWTYYGHGSTPAAPKQREPLGLFEDDRTILVYRASEGEVVPLSALATLYPRVLFPEGDRLAAPTLVLLDFVRQAAERACLTYLHNRP